MKNLNPGSSRIEGNEQNVFPGRKLHLASLANVAGIVLFYIYYRYMHPDPEVASFWRSSWEANALFIVLAAIPFIVIGYISASENRWVKRTLQKGRSNWSQEDISGLLNYLFKQPRLFFIFSFLAWVFEGVLWGIISWRWDEQPFGETFLVTFMGTVTSGALAALIAFIIADKISRQEVLIIFPHLETLDQPVRLSLRIMGLVMLCVVGVMPVLITTYLSYVHAEHAILLNDLSRLSSLRNTNLAILGLSIFLTLMAMGWISRSISQPLIRMAELVKKVSARDFETQMPVVTDDEVGYVSSGLNQMVRELSALYQSLERKVEERTIELNRALQEIETSNRKIVDGIRYSKRIQNSLLPEPERLRTVLPQSFCLWMPRDVVGGDFYYAESFGDDLVIAVIDCTGHGVPGALMTMVAASALRRIIIDEECRNPAVILQKLNMNVKQLLHQDSQSTLSDDGLDASFCHIDLQNRQLTFAGARQPLTCIRDGRVETIRGDRHSIGYKKSDLAFEFTNHSLELDDKTTVYLYTDGITDQLGGERRLPFGTRRLGTLLLGHRHLPLPDQQEVILKAFQAYAGANEIQDDVTILGFRV